MADRSSGDAPTTENDTMSTAMATASVDTAPNPATSNGDVMAETTAQAATVVVNAESMQVWVTIAAASVILLFLLCTAIFVKWAYSVYKRRRRHTNRSQGYTNQRRAGDVLDEKELLEPSVVYNRLQFENGRASSPYASGDSMMGSMMDPPGTGIDVQLQLQGGAPHPSLDRTSTNGTQLSRQQWINAGARYNRPMTLVSSDDVGSDQQLPDVYLPMVGARAHITPANTTRTGDRTLHNVYSTISDYYGSSEATDEDVSVPRHHGVRVTDASAPVHASRHHRARTRSRISEGFTYYTQVLGDDVHSSDNAAPRELRSALASDFEHYEAMACQTSTSPNSGETSEDFVTPSQLGGTLPPENNGWRGRKPASSHGDQSLVLDNQTAVLLTNDEAAIASADPSGLWYASATVMHNPTLCCDNGGTECSSGNSGEPNDDAVTESVRAVAAAARHHKRRTTSLLTTRSGKVPGGAWTPRRAASDRLRRPYSQDSNGYMPMNGCDPIAMQSSGENSGDSGRYPLQVVDSATVTDKLATVGGDSVTTDGIGEEIRDRKVKQLLAEVNNGNKNDDDDDNDDVETKHGHLTGDGVEKELIRDGENAKAFSKDDNNVEGSSTLENIDPYAVVHRSERDIGSLQEVPMFSKPTTPLSSMAGFLSRHRAASLDSRQLRLLASSANSSGYHSRQGSNVTETSLHSASLPLRSTVRKSEYGLHGNLRLCQTVGVTASPPPPPPGHLPVMSPSMNYSRRFSLPLVADPSTPPSSPANAMFENFSGQEHTSASMQRSLELELQSKLAASRVRQPTTPSNLGRDLPALPPYVFEAHATSSVRAPTPDPRAVLSPPGLLRSPPSSKGVLKQRTPSALRSMTPTAGSGNPTSTDDRLHEQPDALGENVPFQVFSPGGKHSRVCSPPPVGRLSSPDLRLLRGTRPGSSNQMTILEQLPEGSHESVCDLVEKSDSAAEKTELETSTPGTSAEVTLTAGTAAVTPTSPEMKKSSRRSPFLHRPQDTMRRLFRRSSSSASPRPVSAGKQVAHAPRFSASQRSRSHPACPTSTMSAKVRSGVGAMANERPHFARHQSMCNITSTGHISDLPSSSSTSAIDAANPRDSGDGTMDTLKRFFNSLFPRSSGVGTEQVIVQDIDRRPRAKLPGEVEMSKQALATREGDRIDDVCYLDVNGDEQNFVYDVADRGLRPTRIQSVPSTPASGVPQLLTHKPLEAMQSWPIYCSLPNCPCHNGGGGARHPVTSSDGADGSVASDLPTASSGVLYSCAAEVGIKAQAFHSRQTLIEDPYKVTPATLLLAEAGGTPLDRQTSEPRVDMVDAATALVSPQDLPADGRDEQQSHLGGSAQSCTLLESLSKTFDLNIASPPIGAEVTVGSLPGDNKMETDDVKEQSSDQPEPDATADAIAMANEVHSTGNQHAKLKRVSRVSNDSGLVLARERNDETASPDGDSPENLQPLASNENEDVSSEAVSGGKGVESTHGVDEAGSTLEDSAAVGRETVEPGEEDSVPAADTRTYINNTLSYAAAPPGDRVHPFYHVLQRDSEPSVDLAARSALPYRIIDGSEITLQREIGQGSFSVMWQGTWSNAPTSSVGVDPTVSIKAFTTSTSSGQVDFRQFMTEAKMLYSFDNENIIKLLGVVADEDRPLMVLELMANGALLPYLRSLAVQRRDVGLPRLLLAISQDVICGLGYLHQLPFLHRDLAGKHLFLTEDLRCKIGDFGRSDVLEDQGYYDLHGGKLEVKWCAPEVLYLHQFSSASDIWSFGVVLYEIWSLGRRPYPSWTAVQAAKEVCSGYRMSPPVGAIEPLYEIMIDCWHPRSKRRPSARRLVGRLQQLTAELSECDQHVIANTLGRPPEAAWDLFPQLQHRYRHKSR